MNGLILIWCFPPLPKKIIPSQESDRILIPIGIILGEIFEGGNDNEFDETDWMGNVRITINFLGLIINTDKYITTNEEDRSVNLHIFS